MPANQPYPGESHQQFMARQGQALNPQNPVHAKALKEGVQQDNRTLAQLIAEQRKRNAQQKGGPRGRPPQQQKRVLPANPTMQDLAQFAPRIGQQVPSLRGRGMMVIGSQNAQLKYAQAMYQRALQQQEMEQQRDAANQNWEGLNWKNPNTPTPREFRSFQQGVQQGMNNQFQNINANQQLA